MQRKDSTPRSLLSTEDPIEIHLPKASKKIEVSLSADNTNYEVGVVVEIDDMTTFTYVKAASSYYLGTTLTSIDYIDLVNDPAFPKFYYGKLNLGDGSIIVKGPPPSVTHCLVTVTGEDDDGMGGRVLKSAKSVYFKAYHS